MLSRLSRRAPAACGRRAAALSSAHPNPVLAAWGDDVVFGPATVAASAPAATGTTTVTVDVGEAVAAGFTRPGMFVQLREKGGDGKPGFFAVASPPGAHTSRLEFLVKPVPGTFSETLAGLQAGDELEASAVMGKGFVLDGAPEDGCPTLLCVCTGTGIAPVRSLIEADASMGGVKGRGGVTLLFGVKDAEHMPYKERLADWEAAGVEVVPVFSAVVGGRYVQDALAERGVSDPAGTAAVLCGQKEMAQAVTELLTGAGVAPDRVILNF